MDDKTFLKMAVEQAKKSAQMGGFPAGAIVARDGKTISEGVSMGNKLHDPTSHAETVAIREACQKLQTVNLVGATLYESLECCNMCFSVSYWAGISRIVYACRKTEEMVKKYYYEGDTSNKLLNSNNNRQIDLVFIPEFENEVVEGVSVWEKRVSV